MKWQKYHVYLFIFILAVSALIRFPELALRPMHGDEAVNAVKFGNLLESGTYIYDPHEYHGPTLYYVTLLSAWANSLRSFKDLNEFALRSVPVILGILTIFSLFFLRKEITYPILFLSTLFLTISPAVVYYNRYYIHESLLIFLTTSTIIFGYFFTQKKNVISAVFIGICLGLMMATKETWIIFFTAMVLSLVIVVKVKPILKLLNIRYLICIILGAIFIFIVFYSAFFTNLQGILDAITTYKNYLSRAGNAEIHFHPWYYYLKLLLFFKNGSSPMWSEGILIILSSIGMLLVFRKHVKSVSDITFLRFISVYTFLLITIFSLVPYKTPWNLLGFMPGLAIMSAFTIVELSKIWSHRYIRFAFIILIVFGFIHLLWQSLQLNYVYYASPANPYVYAHPSTDVFIIQKQVEKVVKAHPDADKLYIQVIAENNDYWPLPWYFRRFNCVGWWDHVPDEGPPGAVIILNADLESDLIKRLYETPPPGQRDLYLPLFHRYIELRPGIEFRGYIRKSDWDLVNRSNPKIELD